MSEKKETKTNHNKKITIGSVPINQRSPSSKHSHKNTVTNANGTIDGHPTNKIESHSPLIANNKPSPTKTSRNQVSANWNSVAGSLKSQRNFPSAKKIGKIVETNPLLLLLFFLNFSRNFPPLFTIPLFCIRFSSKIKCNCIRL